MFSDVVMHVQEEMKQVEAYLAEVDQERAKALKAVDEMNGKLDAARDEYHRLERALANLQSEAVNPFPKDITSKGLPGIAPNLAAQTNKANMPYLPEER